jgi:serine phosphatase RsbU (regulator of sigma subunit)/Tfp pilus assembly protein PilF
MKYLNFPKYFYIYKVQSNLNMVKKAKKAIIILLLTCSINRIGSGQNIDSLLTNLRFAQDSASKIELYFQIANYYFNVERNSVETEKFLLEAKKLAEDQSNILLIVKASNELGVFYRNHSRYSESLVFHKEALRLASQLEEKKWIARTLNNIGVVYRRLDDHSKAAEFHLRALKIAEEIRDTFSISVSENSLGNIYSLNGRYDQALLYFNKALQLSKAQKNPIGQAINYNNIGEVYEFSGDYDKAKEFYSKSLEINKQVKSEKGIAICINALGKILLYTGYPKTAYKYFSEASIIDKKIGDKKFIADSYINLGRALVVLKRYDEAKQCLYQGIKIAQEIKSKVHFQLANEELSKIYANLNDFKASLTYFKNSTLYKDSVLNEKNARHLATIQTIYETEKKEKENQILRQKQELSDKENKRKNYFIYSLILGLFLSMVLIIVVYLALLTKRRANRLLSEQKDEIESQSLKIEQQRKNIEVKNRNLEEAYQIIENYIGKITDSIRYAEQIQKSILPDMDRLELIFRETFTFYKPKDIVSGDFYWYTVRGDMIYIALADCTGHGVPGAFMSIIGTDLLNQIVIQQACEEPDKILSFLNKELREKLRKGKEELILKDSMDVALCIINKNTREIRYSGALIPLFILSDGEVTEIKPNYTSLGTSHSLFNREFRVHTFILKPNSWIYLTTDGYIDQFGGENHKKFMRTRFVEFLVKINHLPARVQQEEIEKQFDSWMGENEQLDDVLVWGINI